jgi:hypothetical protein
MKPNSILTGSQEVVQDSSEARFVNEDGQLLKGELTDVDQSVIVSAFADGTHAAPLCPGAGPAGPLSQRSAQVVSHSTIEVPPH